MDYEDYFVLKDNYGPFNVSMADLIKCLLIAEKNGCVPKVPEDWKAKAASSGPGEIPGNHAVLDEERLYRCNRECCNGDFAFVFRDSVHYIHITLETILICMMSAERQGIVPEMGDNFWLPAGACYLRDFRDIGVEE